MAQTPSDFLETYQGRSFSHVQLKEMLLMENMKRKKNRNENKLDHTAFWRFHLKTAWHGEAIRTEETLWPHCQLSCYTTNTSPVSPPSSSTSCLSLSSISHQELPPINRDSRHQARNLRRVDLFSRLFNIISKHKPVPQGRWTT